MVVTGQPVTSPSSQKKCTGDERKQRDIVTISPCATPNIGSGGSDWATEPVTSPSFQRGEDERKWS